MAKPVTSLNPSVLKWARERAGYSVSDIALALKKDIEIIERWESGLSAPTYVQLEKLSYKFYKRPLALFFFPEPPAERDPTQEFRTLPDFEIANLSRDTRFALRQAEAMQLALKELNDEINPSPNKIFQDIKVQVDMPVPLIAEKVRDYLGVTLEAQRSWKSTEEALRHWRSYVQNMGIFVFKRSFKQKDICGFCLINSEFPVIYINNSLSSKSRQIFTLFHELTHIFLHTSGVTKWNDKYIDSLTGINKKIEVFANKCAAECLVPSQDFDKYLRKNQYNDQSVKELADRYRVSREVILRKLLDRGLVKRAYYEAKAKEWMRQNDENRNKSKFANSNATQASYLGDKYLQLAFSKYYQGRYGIEQLADYLNVKVQRVEKLEQYALKGAFV